MSDTTTTAPPPPVTTLPGIQAGLNVNDPLSYTPDAGVTAVAPIVAQVTGGDPGNTVAGVQGAQKESNNFFGDIGAQVAKVTSQLQAAFNAGKATGGSPQAIAGQVDTLAQQKAAALFQQGVANANVVGMDALHKAAAASQTAKDAVTLGLDPNNPDAIAGMKAVADNSAEVFKQTGALAEMRKNGFFDNPAKYLIDRVINMPIAEDRARDALKDTKEASDAITAQTKSLADRSVVDTALNSTDTVNRAAELYKGALASATAAGIDPLIQAQQIKISAYDLGVAQQNAATNSARLGMELQEQPLRMSLMQQQAGFYNAEHSALMEQQNATAALRKQELTDKIKKASNDKDAVDSVNGTYGAFGLKGNITDVNRIPEDVRKPLLDITSNLSASDGKMIADSPAHALELLQGAKIPLGNVPPGQLATIQHLHELYNSGVDDSLKVQPGETKPTGKALADKVDSYVTQTLLKEQSGGFSSTNKFYTLPSVGTSVNSDWAKNNPVMMAMRPLAMDSSGAPIKRDMDGSLLLNTAAGLISSGKLSENQAVAALQDYAKHTRNDVQTAGGFSRYAIPLQDNFRVGYNRAGFGVGDRADRVDLLSTPDLLNKLRLQTASMKIGKTVSDIMSNYTGVAP